MEFLTSLLVGCLLATQAVVALPSPRSATSGGRPIPTSVPSYVVKYAPLVYLYSGETFLPSDLEAQISNTKPDINLTQIANPPSPLNLNTLNELNNVADSDGGNNVYLTSTDYISIPDTIPQWLKGVTPEQSGLTAGATSCAIVVYHHPDNVTVDAFYMYFYAYNWGGIVAGVNLDDHVGDWEHNMVRFKNGQPSELWYSQHANGQAFTYDAVHKSADGRPYSFSANGSHANYATSGYHDHTFQAFNLPDKYGFLEDVTDKGPLWDPTLNAIYSEYKADSSSFVPYDNSTPVGWLSYTGKWGDEQYPSSDPRQINFLDLGVAYKYSSGPTGPRDKSLVRTDVCPPNGYPCIVYPIAVS